MIVACMFIYLTIGMVILGIADSVEGPIDADSQIGCVIFWPFLVMAYSLFLLGSLFYYIGRAIGSIFA